jgi:hypothetical protein
MFRITFGPKEFGRLDRTRRARAVCATTEVRRMEIMIFAAAFLSFGVRNAVAVAQTTLAAGSRRWHRRDGSNRRVPTGT